MPVPVERTEWQRRYDESLAAERAKASDADVTAGEVAAVEASGCLPGWLGVVAFAVTAVVMLVRRRIRRARPRPQ